MGALVADPHSAQTVPATMLSRGLCWADLLERVFAIDVTSCPRCHCRLQIIAFINDPDVVDRCIRTYLENGVDYVSNILERTYPIGMDTQIFSTATLADVDRRTHEAFDREHGAVFIHRNPEIYSVKNVAAPAEFTDPTLRLTLDTIEDYRLIVEVFDELYPRDPAFGLAHVMALLRRRPELRKINGHVPHRYV